MRVAVGDIFAGALASAPEDECCHLLHGLRTAFEADEAFLARAGAPPRIVHTDAAAGGVARSAVPEGLSFDADGPAEIGADGVLALAFHPRDDVPWCLGLVRGTGWGAPAAKAFGQLRPHLTLVLEHALLRSDLAARRARDAEAATARERMLAMLSHELRNPLAPILMWTSTLQRLRPDDPDVQRAGQAIAHAVSVERRLIDDLVDISRLERGILQLQREPLDLRDVVRKAVELHREQAGNARLALDAELPAEPLAIDGDAVRLAQVLGNLLGNAVKFTPAGGTIAVTLARRGDGAELSVTDSGPGLPAGMAPQLFAPFVQGPNARGGLGVGLAVARLLVELHSGTIEAIPSPKGSGTSLRIRLPLRAAAECPGS